MEQSMRANLTRREFNAGIAGSSLTAMVQIGRAQAPQPPTRPSTHTYKRVGELEIKADVHRPAAEANGRVVVWIHGGALINGHRQGIDGRLQKQLLNAGYTIVSIDYRLAPETKLPAILEDVRDAFDWLRGEGSRQLKLDTARIAVAGGSAGGYLTLAAGYLVKPSPTVLVSLWGYGDLIGDWYSRPSPHARHHRVRLTETEAWQHVSGPPISDSRDRKGDGGAFYQFCRQHGTWPRAVTGWDPVGEAERFTPWMPVRNVTPAYPPTLLIHGTVDTDVPYDQSVMMARELANHGVAHELVSIPGGEHGLGGGDPQLIDAAYQSALAFIDRFMQRGANP
jgi:acetyl esterase/lipase